jgi:hypothetical protein
VQVRSEEMKSTITLSRPSVRLRLTACCFLFFALYSVLFTAPLFALIFDRVVAFVDNEAITLSEFQERLESMRQISPDISEESAINTMINRILLVREARKYKIEADTEEDMVREYVDLKVRSFIRVDEKEIAAFYNENIDRFRKSSYEDVRDEIETYLTEKKLNERLRENLEEMRKTAYIKIQLDAAKNN